MQQNSKCWLYGDREETVNHIINKCSKLAQKKYKIRKALLGGKGDPRGIVQEIRSLPY